MFIWNLTSIPKQPVISWGLLSETSQVPINHQQYHVELCHLKSQPNYSKALNSRHKNMFSISNTIYIAYFITGNYLLYK